MTTFNFHDCFSNCQDILTNPFPGFMQRATGISSVFLKFLTLPYSHILSRTSFHILNSCFNKWSILPNPSVRPLILLLHKYLLLHFDIKLYIYENNPKTLNSLIRRLKSYYKNRDDIDPYKISNYIMSSQAASCPDAKQMYINGHFNRFSILTNALGIVRYYTFLDDGAFKSAHTEIRVEKKYDSPDENKSIGESSFLAPVLNDFFLLHPDIHPVIFCI